MGITHPQVYNSLYGMCPRIRMARKTDIRLSIL
jgi:hypothetical protein